MSPPKALLQLFDEVEQRNRTLSEQHPQWPCRAGCDACCRRLSRVPELHRVEWELLASALCALPSEIRAKCLAAAQRLRREVAEHGETRPVTCPLLDAERGMCRVYAARPLACRSYGFSRARDHDAWCERVATHVAGAREALVVGNHDALKRRLFRVDPDSRDLLAWLDDAAWE